VKETQEFEKKRLVTIHEGSAIGKMSVVDNFPHSTNTIMATDAEVVLRPPCDG